MGFQNLEIVSEKFSKTLECFGLLKNGDATSTGGQRKLTTNLMQKYSGSPACEHRGSFAPLLCCCFHSLHFDEKICMKK